MRMHTHASVTLWGASALNLRRHRRALKTGAELRSMDTGAPRVQAGGSASPPRRRENSGRRTHVLLRAKGLPQTTRMKENQGRREWVRNRKAWAYFQERACCGSQLCGENRKLRELMRCPWESSSWPTRGPACDPSDDCPRGKRDQWVRTQRSPVQTCHTKTG